MKEEMIQSPGEQALRRAAGAAWLALILMLTGAAGCGGGPEEKRERFFTSGSREADQRATQRMAKAEQLAEEAVSGDRGGGESAEIERRQTLYDRLGGEAGLRAIVDDFTERVMQDPRVNWDRGGVRRGGLFRRDTSPVWQGTPENVERLKRHLGQFLALATGGPARYQGRDIHSAHAGMRITNPEFDAAIGDLKAALDRLNIADTEQKELMAIVESTRPQIVTER